MLTKRRKKALQGLVFLRRSSSILGKEMKIRNTTYQDRADANNKTLPTAGIYKLVVSIYSYRSDGLIREQNGSGDTVR